MRPDLVLCLAVVHHLALTNNVPLDEIVAFLADFGAPLVVEFPHRDDVMATRLLARKRTGLFDAYDVANWERAVEQRFVIERAPVDCRAARARSTAAARASAVSRLPTGCSVDVVAVAAGLVDRHVVAAGAIEVGEVADERPAVAVGDVAADHAGEPAVDGDQQLRRLVRPVDRAGDGERHLAVVGRQVGELGALVDRRRVVAVRADLELGDVAADEIAVVADRREPDPVVAVRELVRRAVRRCRARRRHPSTPVARPSASLPSNSEWPSNSQSTSASSRSTIDGSTSIALGAVVADLSRRLARRLDEQRHAEHLLAVVRR